MSIEQIFNIPNMEKVDNTEDYNYPAKYINKLFKFKDKYVLFNDKSYEEFSSNLIDIMIDLVKDNINIEKNLTELNNNIDSKIKNKFDEINLILSANIKDTNDSIRLNDKNLDSKIKKLEIDLKSKFLEFQNLDKIKELIDNELKVVYSNYEKVIKELINKKAEELSKEIKENSKKIDPMNIMMYRKMGMELKDIMELAKNGLI
jgi:hypothetical protein